MHPNWIQVFKKKKTDWLQILKSSVIYLCSKFERILKLKIRFTLDLEAVVFKDF